MFNIAPNEIPLPAFLDPLLEYLDNVLPEPIYSTLLTFLSHFLSLFSGLLSIITTLLRSNFSDWNAQTILPPLITVLAAYLALVNLYNTTRWFFRTTIFFLKWGAILSMLIGGASWFMATRGQDLATQGIVSVIGSTLWDVINRPEGNAADRKGRSRSQKRKPKAWDSFERHRQWETQADHEEGGKQQNEGARIVKDIAGFAARILGNSGWLDAAKSVIEDATAEIERDGGHPMAKKKTKGKTKAGTRSR
jgi:hypothetical protein